MIHTRCNQEHDPGTMVDNNMSHVRTILPTADKYVPFSNRLDLQVTIDW